MEYAELIKCARTIADSIHIHSSFQDWEAAEKDTLEKCADALEAAEKRIAELEDARKDGKELWNEAWKALQEKDKRIAELEAQLPKEGEWIATSVETDGSRFTGERCSRCGWWKSMGFYNYCPNCGARMKTVTDCHTLNKR